jgi:hypothetical protein
VIVWCCVIWASSYHHFEGSQCPQNVHTTQQMTQSHIPEDWTSFFLLVLRSKYPVIESISFQFTQWSRRLFFLTSDDEKRSRLQDTMFEQTVQSCYICPKSKIKMRKMKVWSWYRGLLAFIYM